MDIIGMTFEQFMEKRKGYSVHELGTSRKGNRKAVVHHAIPSFYDDGIMEWDEDVYDLVVSPAGVILNCVYDGIYA